MRLFLRVFEKKANSSRRKKREKKNNETREEEGGVEEDEEQHLCPWLGERHQEREAVMPKNIMIT